MKTGRTLQALAVEIERQSKVKADYLVSTGALYVEIAPNAPEGTDMQAPNLPIAIGGDGLAPHVLNEIAHDQVAEWCGISKPYYRKMRADAPDLIKTNVERWFRKFPAARLFRTLDEKGRAFLSNSFDPLDNYEFAQAALPILAQRKLRVESCEITEKRLYIKAVDEQLYRDVPKGHKMGDGSHTIFDTCAPAIILSNSEVGFGRLVVETGVYTRACTNLSLWANGGMKRTHVGARHKLAEGENIERIMSKDTKRKTQTALWAQVQDVISAAFNPEVFGKRIEKLTATAENQIAGKVEKAIKIVGEDFSLNEGETESVLKHLIEGGSLTQYGVHAALTRAAQDVADYDRATEMEYMGGKVIDLSAREWNRIAVAA